MIEIPQHSIPLYIFSAIAIILIVKKVIEMILVRLGFVKVHLALPNHRMRIIWRKPKGGKITFKDRSFEYDVKKLVFNGNTPVVYYNAETGEQMDFYGKSSTKISALLLDKLINEAFNLGKDYMRRRQDRVMQLMQIMFLLLIVIAALVGYSTFFAAK